jgi:hypothetical protein
VSAVLQARASQNVARPRSFPVIVSSQHHGSSQVERRGTYGLSSLTRVLEATSSERVLEPTDRWCVCVCIRARGNPASRSDLPLVLRCAVLCFAFASSDLNQPSRTPHTASHRVPAGGCNRHEPIVPKVSNLPCEPPGEMPSASPVDTAITPKLLIIAPRRTLRACWACSACLMEPFTESLSSLDATRHY